MNLRDIHVGHYGAVMGLAGLGLTARAAAPLFPGVFRAPAYFTEAWILLSVVAVLLLLVLYLFKLKNNRAGVVEDFTNPALLGFCGAFPVGLSLVAGGLAPYVPDFASGLWWLACVVLVAFQAWGISRWLSGGVELAKLNAGWLILIVGGIVTPGPGIALGHGEASRFFFGFSACAATVLVPLLFARAALAAPLPEPLRPTWFILLVPPSLIYANGAALFGLQAFDALYYASLVVFLALVFYGLRFLRWPFGPAWWAFTFPLDALAYAAARYSQTHPGQGPWRAIAGALLLLATLAVAGVLLRNLYSTLATPRSASSRAG
ncbi:MAG: hypothetical protein ACM30H_00965 [Clostridia bacterium]